MDIDTRDHHLVGETLPKHNDEIWQAVQPALHFVSKVLTSNHPYTWGWADLRNDQARRRGVDCPDRFAVWPLASGGPDDLDRATQRGSDGTNELVAAQFDTTRYVCEMLRHCIEWDLLPRYRLAEMDEPRHKQPRPVLGTMTLRPEVPGATRPFKFQLGIATEYLWALLVDDYAPAEKAGAPGKRRSS